MVFPVGAWTCFEIFARSASTTLDVWIDDAEVPDMHPTNITLDTYDTVRFGFEKYAGLDADAGAATLDLVRRHRDRHQRIGCE